MATTAELTGHFDADVWAMADAVTFSGETKDDLRLFGRTLEVNGDVRGCLTAVGNSIVVSNGAVVHGIAVLVGETVISEGDVRGSSKSPAAAPPSAGMFAATCESLPRTS